MSVTLLYNGDSWHLHTYWGTENLSNNNKHTFIIPEMSIRKERLVILWQLNTKDWSGLGCHRGLPEKQCYWDWTNKQRNKVDWGMFYIGVPKDWTDVWTTILWQEGQKVKMLKEGKWLETTKQRIEKAAVSYEDSGSLTCRYLVALWKNSIFILKKMRS